MLAMVAAAVTLKAAVVDPAATVTEAGTASAVLLLASVTLDPPAGAAWLSVTVQVLTALGPRLAGVQPSVETKTDTTRPMLVVCELLPSDAVTVAL